MPWENSRPRALLAPFRLALSPKILIRLRRENRQLKIGPDIVAYPGTVKDDLRAPTKISEGG
jgi:hypothetical protein